MNATVCLFRGVFSCPTTTIHARRQITLTFKPFTNAFMYNTCHSNVFFIYFIFYLRDYNMTTPRLFIQTVQLNAAVCVPSR